MSKLIITHWNQWICSVLTDGRKPVQISLEPEQGEMLVNSIYIGKVQNIVKNINAAFIDIGNGVNGYYSLSENQAHWYVNPSHSGTLRAGDEIIVQVARDAVKTKAPVLTGKLTLTGRLSVVTLGGHGIGFSSKIHDRSWKERMKPLLSSEAGGDVGLIVRTNGQEASGEELLEEIRALKQTLYALVHQAYCRSCYTCLFQAPSAYLTNIRDMYSGLLERIITDDTALFQEIHRFLAETQPKDLDKLRLYEDELLPLGKLYAVDQAVEQALSKRVWLKSGGYLVIEPTEALVVIDVNTGKYSGKKTMEETILKINLEAAEEICRQIRLRNLSGIIIVDFIDMASEEDKKLLFQHLEQAAGMDPVKTTVVDMTSLNLVELTRKKIRRPLHEQIKSIIT